MKKNNLKFRLLGGILALLMYPCGIFAAPDPSLPGDYYDWGVRTDRYGKPAGIFEETPFPITETTTEYSIKNDEFPLGKTYYLGTKYYVDGGYTGGANDGSWQKPWTSVKTAVWKAPAGNVTIIIRGAHDSFNGIYNETYIVLKPGIDDTRRFMLVGYGQERPIIDGNFSTSDMITATRQPYTYNTVQRLRLQNNWRDGINFSGMWQPGLSGTPEGNAEKYNYIIDVDLYNIGVRVSYGTQNAMIYFSNASNGWIFHVTAKHTLQHCIKVGDGASDAIVEWSIAGECGYWPGIAAETGITDFNNQIHQWPQGFDFPNDARVVASNNTLRYSISYDALFGGVQIRNSVNFSMHHNEIYDSPRITSSNMGLSCTTSGTNCQQIYVYGLLKDGATALDKVYIYSNVIRDSAEPQNGTGIFVKDLTSNHSVYIYNNLLYNNNPSPEILFFSYSNVVPYPYSGRFVGIYNNTILHNSSQPAIRAPIWNGDDWNNGEVNIKNNIITNTGTGPVLSLFRGIRPTADYDNNLYYYPNGTLGATAGANDYAYGASTNPLFAVEPSGAYSWGMGNLLQTSPAKDAALDLLASFVSDFNLILRPQGPTWDIGAYEYLSPYGDVSGDGAITAYDAALVLQNDPRATQDKADVNGDGVVDTLDAALIAQRAVGL